jgi:DNA-directed RNA polymerase specialized sigma24 family protein
MLAAKALAGVMIKALTVEQAAELLGISSSTADNYWAYARSWLRIKLTDSDDQE